MIEKVKAEYAPRGLFINFIRIGYIDFVLVQKIKIFLGEHCDKNK